MWPSQMQKLKVNTITTAKAKNTNTRFEKGHGPYEHWTSQMQKLKANTNAKAKNKNPKAKIQIQDLKTVTDHMTKSNAKTKSKYKCNGKKYKCKGKKYKYKVWKRHGQYDQVKCKN